MSGDPPSEVLAWTLAAVGAGARPLRIVSLRQTGSGSPWRVDYTRGSGSRSVVLKTADPSDPGTVARFLTEMAALEVATASGVAAPRIIAADGDGSTAGAVALLVTRLPGSSRIPRTLDRERLRRLGAEAAIIGSVEVRPSQRLPRRGRPLEGAGLDVDGSGHGPSGGLFRWARQRLGEVGGPRSEALRLVHGDLWQGNTLWAGSRYQGAIDWDFAGVGPPELDLASLRCDAAVMFGARGPDALLAGWQEPAGVPPHHLDRWDVVAGLSTPVDLGGWLVNFHAQGRTDLTLETVTARRDAYLATAAGRLG